MTMRCCVVQNAKAVACAQKSNAGHLFCVEKYFVFVVRPTTIIKFEDIRTVQFSRTGQIGGGSMATFDLEVELRSSDTR